jgi:probable rRNA maturation factor
LLFRLKAQSERKVVSMILIEPAIEKQFRRTALRKRAIGNFLARAARAAELEGAVSVLLTGDEEIRRLNREFRHKDKATDVLSFPAAQVNGHAGVAGDLAISVETAACEAERRGHPLEVELKILLLHGVLHLAGWDHETDSGEMSEKEEALRAELGLGEGLIARAETQGRAQSTKRRAQTHVRESRPFDKLRAGCGAPGSENPTFRYAKDGAPKAAADKEPRRGKKR